MQIRVSKPFLPLTELAAQDVPGTTGVYEIADSDGIVIDIDYAGGRTLFGLRGVLGSLCSELEPGHQFRFEIHSQYLSRYEELLMIYKSDTGALPRRVLDRGRTEVGRLSPL